MLDKIIRGKTPQARRTVLYGVHGIGKSTWASQWPDAVFVQTEDGIADIDCAKFPLARDLGDAYEAIIGLGSGGHEFKTLVLDSADWLERLIWKSVCQKEGKKAITDFGYGAGYGKSAAIFSDMLTAMNACRNVGMHIVVLAHSAVSRYENPTGDSYDRYTPKLHKDTSALLQEWADEVLFANYDVLVRKSDEGFGRERSIGIGSGDRVLYATERPSHVAKNRLGLPDKMPFVFSEYAKFLKG